VTLIEWPSICTDIRSISPLVHLCLEAVALQAERLQRSTVELIGVALVRDHVVSFLGCSGLALLEAYTFRRCVRLS